MEATGALRCVQGGGGSRRVRFAVVNFAVGNFAEPLDFVWYPPPESTMCTASVREIRGEPGISRGKFRVQFETRNFPREIKVPRTPPPPVLYLIDWIHLGLSIRAPFKAPA